MSVLTDTALWHCAHQRRCLELNRCVCGHARRREQDFDAQLRRAMERYPETPRERQGLGAADVERKTPSDTKVST